ncbi:MAG: hypothetical protein K5871_06160 [Lachnospiraceae bacterium]|nr:hypothetical protein [Lachnospiraceae bacterium]
MSQKQFDDLRKLHDTFEYRKYEMRVEDGELFVRYRFSIPGLRDFMPEWRFPLGERGTDLSDPILRSLIFNLGLVETISYYKTVCPETVVIKCGSLTAAQKDWWRKLYYNGLGEFLYRNGITVSRDRLVRFECTTTTDEQETLHDDRTYSGCLVPVGGGKDSVVSLELLKGEDITTYVVNENATATNVIAKCAHKKGTYTAKRTLDPQVIRMNEEGYMNGHIPFSAVLAFSSVIAAYLCGFKYIALSNETSANESTVPGTNVNHQYSKSYEFEEDFNEYFSLITDSDIHYFSLLRPFSEAQIAGVFASKGKEYFKAFRSCNRGSKKGIWCCACPKCLFVYIILSPFIDEKELIEIFGEKLLDKESLDEDFRELVGLNENKPFECVGTRSEVASCLTDYIEKGGKSMLTDRYEQEIRAMNAEPMSKILSEWCPDNSVPEEFTDRLRSALEELK